MKFCLESLKLKVKMQERKSFNFPPKILYENRYCNQDDFSVLVCGGMNEKSIDLKSVYKLDGPKFDCEMFTSMPKRLWNCKTAVINSDLFVFSREFSSNSKVKTVYKFCTKTKTWSTETRLILNDIGFYVCSFKKNLYVVYSIGKCFVYNLKNKTWTELAKMMKHRQLAACSVFEGKIVVTGGYDDYNSFKSVEAYDYYENKWTYLPDMIKHKSSHAQVSMGNKLFVFKEKQDDILSEVFDSVSRKFTLFQPYNSRQGYCSHVQAFSVGCNIVAFSYHFEYTGIFIYDVQNNRWRNHVKDLQNLRYVSCVKLSKF